MVWNKTPKTTTKYPNQTITFTVAKPLKTIIHQLTRTANNNPNLLRL
ncbi:hypothetical protein PP590_gp19 [Pseudoalteromonas phage HS1]|nr:hypothetical protein PP589_gp51 [Pseudoalteromonas phage HS5]YP_010660176.1 hypothetical protein PP590_gp19 [Pseudoalteromonas phage HS1]